RRHTISKRDWSSDVCSSDLYKGNSVAFDEVNCDVLICLPIEDVQVTFDSFPLELKMKDFMGGTASVIQIQGAEFKFDKDYSPQRSEERRVGKELRSWCCRVR